MRPIRRHVWSHESTATGQPTTVRAVRESQPTHVADFPELVSLLAEISYRNPDYALFYRGQPRDYLSSDEGSTIMPTIYRAGPDNRLPRSVIRERFLGLQLIEDSLIGGFPRVCEDKSKHLTLKRFSEVCWAILQHYEVVPTPMLDLTTSLRVACSFATQSGQRDGVLMVLGLPHPHGSISYHVEQEICTLRLITICPPEARRPYFQEGFVSGNFPTRGGEAITSKPDFARRLVAKFSLPRTMWSPEFPAIPRSALFPTVDPMLELATQISPYGDGA